MMFTTTVWLFTLLVLQDPPELARVGVLDEARIPEASGLAASQRHGGIFWTHNDSGNDPLLFAIKADGAIVAAFRLGVPNVDWEEVAVDAEGRLYIGDIGNNGGVLPLRAVYRFDEPDPGKPQEKPLAARLATFYKPETEDGRFDCEAMIPDGRDLILISKRFDGEAAEILTIPLDPPAPVLRPAKPKRLGRLEGFTEPVTAVSVSHDGKRIAVCSESVTRVYERTPALPWKRLGEVYYEPRQYEGITWSGDDLLLAAEGSSIHRIPAALWRRSTPRSVK